MQSDPQDEQQPTQGGHDAVSPDSETGPGPYPPSDLPGQQPPGQTQPPAPPQMPGAPDEGPSPGSSPPPPPPQMPAPSTSTPSWDAGGAGEAVDDPGPPAEAPTSASGTAPMGTPPRSGQSGVQPADPSREPQPDTATQQAPAGSAAPADEGDLLDRICPYLLSEDGTYRSAQPDEGHRCTAQDPPGTLPLAFQERFCLTDRHDRCEMYKYAQSTRSAALEEEGIPAQQVQSARFKPSVRSVPVALGPAAGDQAGQDLSHRPIILIGIGVAVLVIIAFVLATLFGSGGDDPGAGLVDGSSPTPQTTAAAAPTAEPTPLSTPQPQQTSAPDSSPAASAGPALATVPVNYEVQEGEALLAIADKFGVSRRRILRANEGMEDQSPYVAAGDVIIVPASSSLSIEELEAIPGYLGLAE